MAYCTVTEVGSMLKSLSITTSSKVTPTDVETWIDDYSAVMDTKIIRQYSLPVTDTSMLVILKVICQKLVASRIIRVLYAGNMKEIPKVASEWKSEGMELLNEIAEGSIEADAEASSDIVFTGKNDSDGDTREAVFNSDGDNW